MDSIDEAFYFLWNNGHRFINEDDYRNMKNGLYKDEFGFVKGYTIEGLQRLANDGKLSLDGLKLTVEEVEMMFNYIAYKRSLKGNKHAKTKG